MQTRNDHRAESAQTAIRQATLLVVDDDPGMRELLARQLTDAGYDVQLANDGREGLEITRRLRPDYVLCDWIMPGMDGVEFCRAVKADPYLRETYVALLTGRSTLGDRVAGLDAGADDFLMKPLAEAELLARIRAGLRIRQLQRELADARRHAAVAELVMALGQEINSPLTALFGHVELVRQYLETGDEAMLRHHVDRLGEIGGRIADASRRLGALHDPHGR